MFYKPVGSLKTFGFTGDNAKVRLKRLLHSQYVSFIYHCYNHYCCPVGYEQEPFNQSQIFECESYKDELVSSIFLETNSSTQIPSATTVDWIFVADTSRKYPSMHCIKWDDIELDLNTRSPEYLNIRHLDRGIQILGAQTKDSSKIKVDFNNDLSKASSLDKKRGGQERNLHCIIQFKRVTSEKNQLSPSPHLSAAASSSWHTENNFRELFTTFGVMDKEKPEERFANACQREPTESESNDEDLNEEDESLM